MKPGSFESPHSQLSNDPGIMKNGSVYKKIRGPQGCTAPVVFLRNYAVFSHPDGTQTFATNYTWMFEL